MLVSLDTKSWKHQIRTKQAECDWYLHTDRTDRRLARIGGGCVGRGYMSEPTLFSPLAISCEGRS
jgi:hypothetical protein